MYLLVLTEICGVLLCAASESQRKIWVIESPLERLFVFQLPEPDMELYLLYLTVNTLSLSLGCLLCEFIEDDMAQFYST